MKKKHTWILIIAPAAVICLLLWRALQPETLSGTVVDRRVYPDVLELAVDGGDHYGILLDAETKVTCKIGPDIGGSTVDGRKYLEEGALAVVTLGDPVESPWTDYDSCVAGWYRAEKIEVIDGASVMDHATSAKPVIYLYPEETTDVTVRLEYDGELTTVYPAYEGLWAVTAAPDGTLTDPRGMTYNYLYWEGRGAAKYDWSAGFCVAGADTAAFLETALADLGLTRREANEFIVYWLPMMEGNPYNLIAFQGAAYTDTAKLTVDPAPDTVIRVFMAWKRLDDPVEIEPQALTAPERTGFTLVEWGGGEIR